MSAHPFGLSNSLLLGDGMMVSVESTDEAEDEESFGDVGGKSLTLSSTSSRSSNIGDGSGGNFDN